jgi:hypothetical protein
MFLGSGNCNGHFTITTACITSNNPCSDILEVGIRATHRTAGLFAPVAPSVFQVPTGLDGATTRAAWNFEFSVASQLTKIKSLDVLELRITALSGPTPVGSPFNLLTSVGPVTFADVIQDRWGVPSGSPLPTTNPTTFFSSAGDIFQVFS